MNIEGLSITLFIVDIISFVLIAVIISFIIIAIILLLNIMLYKNKLLSYDSFIKDYYGSNNIPPFIQRVRNDYIIQYNNSINNIVGGIMGYKPRDINKI